MLDQNTATIISNAIAVMSAWGAVAIAGFINNHQSIKSEKSKDEKEKRERDRTLLEELCSLCFQVEREIVTTLQIPEQVKNAPPLPVTLSEPINRMSVIVNMYHRSLKSTFDPYLQSLYELQTAFYKIYDLATTTNATPQSNPLELRQHKQKTDIYKERMNILVNEIAKLAQQ